MTQLVKFKCKKCKRIIRSELLESIHTNECCKCRDKRLGFSTLGEPTQEHIDNCKKCQAIEKAKQERAKLLAQS